MWCVLRFYHCTLWLKPYFSILWSYGHILLVVSSARLWPPDMSAVRYNAFNSFDVLWQQPEVSVTWCNPGWAPFPRWSFFFPEVVTECEEITVGHQFCFFCIGDLHRVRSAPQVLSYPIMQYFEIWSFYWKSPFAAYIFQCYTRWNVKKILYLISVSRWVSSLWPDLLHWNIDSLLIENPLIFLRISFHGINH